LQWRLRNAGVEKAEIGTLTLAHPFRWHLTNASVGNRAKFGYPTLAHLLSLGSASETDASASGRNI